MEWLSGPTLEDAAPRDEDDETEALLRQLRKRAKSEPAQMAIKVGCALPQHGASAPPRDTPAGVLAPLALVTSAAQPVDGRLASPSRVHGLADGACAPCRYASACAEGACGQRKDLEVASPRAVLAPLARSQPEPKKSRNLSHKFCFTTNRRRSSCGQRGPREVPPLQEVLPLAALQLLRPRAAVRPATPRLPGAGARGGPRGVSRAWSLVCAGAVPRGVLRGRRFC